MQEMQQRCSGPAIIKARKPIVYGYERHMLTNGLRLSFIVRKPYFLTALPLLLRHPK